MDITSMLAQQVAWTPRSGSNSRGEATYGAEQTVPARKSPKYRDIIGPGREVITTSSLIVTLVEPAIGDLLDGREVVQVDGMTAFDGSEAGYMSLTR